jgi:hypothetical protein
VKQENNLRPGAWAIKMRELKAPEASQHEQIVLVAQEDGSAGKVTAWTLMEDNGDTDTVVEV